MLPVDFDSSGNEMQISTSKRRHTNRHHYGDIPLDYPGSRPGRRLAS